MSSGPGHGMLSRFRLRRPRAAVSILPGEVRLLLARANGAVEPSLEVATSLPDGAVEPGLTPGNLPDPGVVVEALSGLLEDAGSRDARPGLVAVLVPDGAVRVALLPVEGGRPGRAEGDAMARWGLKDLLPVEADDSMVDWAVLAARPADGDGDGEAARRDEPAHDGSWLLALGAHRRVVREYEAVVEGLGWSPGRVLPWTLALACGAAVEAPDGAAARLVLSGVGGRLACLVEVDGIPRLHRAWRGRALPELSAELPTLQQYVRDRLEVSLGDAVVCGDDGWRDGAAAACESLGWRVRAVPLSDALVGALQS